MNILNKKGPLERELASLYKAEQSFMLGRARAKEALVNRALEGKVPQKLQGTLEAAFVKAFTMVFQSGSALIEKTCGRERRQEAFFADRSLLDAEMDKRQLRSFSGAARRAGAANRIISGTAGLGMGILGVGIPDIPVLTALMLKNIYEIAMSYGFDHQSPEERLFILALIRGAVTRGDEIYRIDRDINDFIAGGKWADAWELSAAESETARALSNELLYMKFLQGIPIVGAVGGLYDAVYMKLVSRYADLKYRRRFLLGLSADAE